MSFAIKGIPCPFLITPRNEDEARLGRATLLTPDEIGYLTEMLVHQECATQASLLRKLRALS